MAYRLSDYITYGELFTTSHYGVYGFLVLRTEEQEAGGDHTMIRLELTGDPDPDLQGMHICFEPEEGAEVKYFHRAEHPGLMMRQYGATGAMSAQGWVRALPCSEAEYMTRLRLGEPPPTEWKNRLHLEWYGPNGRMVIELAGPLVEVCTRERDEDDEDDQGDWEPLLNRAPRPEPYIHGETDPGDFEIVAMNADGDWASCTGREIGQGESLEFDRFLEEAGEAAWDEDEDDGEAFMRETRLMDECIEDGEETPIIDLIGGIDGLPDPDDLNEEMAEEHLKALLGRLAMIGVALSVCEHYTPRDTYRLLLKQILPEAGAFKELIGTEWVQHYMTHEYCAKCDEQVLKDYGVDSEPPPPVWN